MLADNFDRHKKLSDALLFVDEIYLESMKAFQSIGGTIDKLLVSKLDGAKWISRK